MDLPVASQAINYDNRLQAAQDIALFCFVTDDGTSKTPGHA
jgi:hypothetical protein